MPADPQLELLAPARASAKCRWCYQDSTKLCDAIVSGHCDADGMPPTCDAPICDAHAHVVAIGRYCIRRGKDKGCHHDTIDHCPKHSRRTA